MLYLYYRIGFLILRVTSQSVAHAIASMIANIKCALSKEERQRVRNHLKMVMPNAKNETLAHLTRGIFKNFGKYLVDFFSLIKNKRDYLKKMVSFEGLENINKALEMGRGCIILTGHFGNWELAGCALAEMGYKINVVALDHKDRRINNLFINVRKMSGIKVSSTGAAKDACLAALDRNEIIAILGDRPYGDRGIEVNFFGRPTVVPRGAALFSLRKNTPIIAAFAYRKMDSDAGYTASLDSPFVTENRGKIGCALTGIMQRYINRFEQYIRKYPDQWYMFGEIWKN